jgi:pyruvate decarboxylase
MKSLLPKLTERLRPFYPEASKIPVPAFVKQVLKEDGEVISHLWFWPRLGFFFQPKDVIVTETGNFCSWFLMIDRLSGW